MGWFIQAVVLDVGVLLAGALAALVTGLLDRKTTAEIKALDTRLDQVVAAFNTRLGLIEAGLPKQTKKGVKS